MGLKTFRPLTPGLRFRVASTFDEITKDTPERSLTEPLRKSGGRNHKGRITCRHIGGGHKRRYRIIDFKRCKRDVHAVVESIEYDPNRTCRIALVQYQDGIKAYIIAPAGLKVGTKIMASDNAEPEIGNALPLRKIPVGIAIHNIEMSIGKGGQMVRGAGSSAQVSSRARGYATVKLPSGEVRLIQEDCYATIGQVSNSDHMNIKLGKAGRRRWLGTRPTVRGVAMNPVDHPNGGGQGKSKGGGGWQHLTSPWGKVAKGGKTRKRYKPTNRFILQRRNSAKANTDTV
ncbi:MAG: 50S ribosomal protein L2 [Verrucomicrobiota bacterium]|nr:50S ribosomal protein L2 [Verrucomicrobiota bacterium]